MKTIEQLAAEFSECYPEIGPKNATLLGCLWDAWQAGKMKEREACEDIADGFMYGGGKPPLSGGKAIQIRDAIRDRTVKEAQEAKESAERFERDLASGIPPF